MTVGEALSIVSSVVSFALGGFSVWLAMHFYKETKDTEKEITNSLAKIETQTATLQKLNAKWMDRLIKNATETRPQSEEYRVLELVGILAQLPQAIATQIALPGRNDSQEELLDELLSCYIVIYYYAALTNYWAQFYLPDSNEFDIEDEFHNLTKHVVDGSSYDFQHFAKILTRVDQLRLNSNPLLHILTETRDFWRHRVRTASDVYKYRSTEGGASSPAN